MFSPTAEFKRKLLEQRQALIENAADSKPASATVELDQSTVGRLSRMDSLQMQAMAQATDRRRAVTLARIERALERIERGEYGYCQTCDEPIAEARLALDASIPLCINCATKAEQAR
ncbi:MAG: TraR/DksA family transcriptional regulator [Arenicellales bacterium WSBS_2016_MAG_OTU3]